MKEFILKNAKFIFFILPLCFFSLIGFIGLYFAIKFPENVPIMGWITLTLFALLPLIFIYGLVFGFTISEKRQNQIEVNRNKIFSDQNGITIEMPLFDKNCFIKWQSIDAIIYYNYVFYSDFTEYDEGCTLYLNTMPIYTKYEKQWFLNKIFSKNSQSKIIKIPVETKNFWEILQVIEEHLKSKVNITTTEKCQHKMITHQEWKLNNQQRERVIFDKFNRNIQQIKNTYQ